tara:strand:- start:7255 stop:8832 length:1578 start_codon:yes stop_codon:yes gene_type:complete
MKTFINKTIDTLSDSNVSSNSLVKILIESTKNSLETNSGISSTYNSLKNGLVELNNHLKNDTITNILEQFDKFEYSDNNRINEMNKEAGLALEIEKIKTSDSYSNPICLQNVIILEESIKENPEFLFYGKFVDLFKQFSYDDVVKESITRISDYINKNVEKLMVLDSINNMKKSKGYEKDIEGLSKMLISESYSSEAIKHRLNSELPILKDLYSRLAMIESKNSSSFTLGSGNSECIIENTIAPTLKTGKNTILSFIDNKFIAISTKNLTKGSMLSESKSSKVYEMDATYIKEKYNSFYTLCESFFNLGFKKSQHGIKSTSIKNFTLEFAADELGKLDVFVNESIVKNPKEFNFSEILTLESNSIKTQVSKILKESSNIFNLEFIKTLTNNSTGKRVIVMELEGDYHVCEMLNQVERVWKNDINEYKLHNYILENFKYDISSIFQVKIDEQKLAIKNIESRKSEIENNISKLENEVNKIKTNIESGQIDSKYFGQLEDIKEQLEIKINSLKEEIVENDLKKKELV